ncbi:hypothetical protein TrVGV298_001288 [Trichoderma virens]|nr:hypothetical protein TrVGV298_001288 [Trichoderma virens]
MLPAPTLFYQPRRARSSRPSCTRWCFSQSPTTSHDTLCGSKKGPIIGALLGQQNGREITIEHAFECHVQEAPQVEGGYLINAEKFGRRLEQMCLVHKDRKLDFVGWYTLLSSSGPSPTILPIHSQILENWNESAVLLGFHPQEVAQHSVGGKLPLTIYESNFEVDDARAENDGEDKKMDDGDSALKLRFREVPYSVETDETEMISMNYVASGGGNAAASAPAPTVKEERPARSIESNGKGKRRLVESEVEERRDAVVDDASALSREEDEMLAALTAKANAIKMLHSRIQLIITYLERLPSSYINGGDQDGESMDTDTTNTTPSLNILRQIQALVSRLDLVIPSDREAFEKEVQSESNNVNLLGLLNSIMQGVNQAKDVGRKFHAIESSKGAARRGTLDYSMGVPFNIPGTGDLHV